MIMLIAFLTMTLDHIGTVFFPDIFFLQVIGRLSFPLFAWGIARGYRSTQNSNKYAVRLLLLAVVSQLPYYLLRENGYLNICFNLFVGLLFLKLYDSQLPPWARWPGLLVLVALPQVLNVEYGTYGLLTILLFHRFWEQESIIYYQAALTLISVIIWHYDPIQLFSVLSPILLLFINNLKQTNFKLPRLLQYGFYPIHLFLFFLFKNGGFNL